MSFQAKDEIVRSRQLKVQRLVIPFTVTSSATPASVVLRNDEPAVLFLRSEGVDQITTASGALDSGETATYSVSPNDANGIMNMLVKLNEVGLKVCRAQVVSRTTGVAQPVFLGDADGLTSAGKLMLTMDSTVNFATTSYDACLEVEYIVAE